MNSAFFFILIVESHFPAFETAGQNYFPAFSLIKLDLELPPKNPNKSQPPPKSPPTAGRWGSLTAAHLPQRSQHGCNMNADAEKCFPFSDHVTYFPAGLHIIN